MIRDDRWCRQEKHSSSSSSSIYVTHNLTDRERAATLIKSLWGKSFSAFTLYRCGGRLTLLATSQIIISLLLLYSFFNDIIIHAVLFINNPFCRQTALPSSKKEKKKNWFIYFFSILLLLLLELGKFIFYSCCCCYFLWWGSRERPAPVQTTLPPAHTL